MRTQSGILSSSVPSVPAFDRRGTFVESLAAALRKIQHGATVDRVTADCTMMFELWRASWTSTQILISLSPLTLCRLPWHFIAWCLAGIPTAAVRDSLDVAAPGDCSSAIKPKIEHRPIFLPAIPFLVEPIGCWARNLGIFCFSMPAGFSRLSIRNHMGIRSDAVR